MRALIACIALLVSACSPRSAITIENAWARATPPGSTVASVYARVESKQADEIVAVATPVAERVEMHVTSEANGTMRMRPVQSVALQPDEPVSFQAGGLHMMLIGLHEPLAAGTSLPLTFTFRTAAPMTVSVKVIAPGDAPPAH
jgi:copper(I)-binding protein